jgi:N-acetylmuramoyl-L-alanine amidase
MHWSNGRKRATVFGILALFSSAVFAQQQPALPQLPSTPVPSAQPRFVVVLDAAHGGSDTGARLSDKLLEKNVTLALSVRLRSVLAARGFQVTTTRETDVLVPALHRSEIANHAQAAACLSLHATATGSGIHLFTSSLGQSMPARFQPWATAQSAYSTRSLKLSSEINSALAHTSTPVTLARTSMQPLDSFLCPAVAIEIAPLAPAGRKPGLEIDSTDYQGRVVEAIASALMAWREEWRQQP